MYVADRASKRRYCSHCELEYANPGALATHVVFCHPLVAADAAPATPLVAKKRARYSTAQKSEVLQRYYELEEEEMVAYPHKMACQFAFGANWQNRKGYLTKWLNKAGQIHAITSSTGRKGKTSRRLGGMPKVHYPDAEDELYVRFLARRVVWGYPCNHYWLRSEFKKILAELNPANRNWEDFGCSTGWAVRFCYRYEITTQAKNNNKAHDQKDREAAIRKFHRYLILSVQHSETQTDPKFGRFGPSHMLHVDQVPLPFASGHSRTLNPKNAASCRIAGVNTSGLEKRQATLQLWICALESGQWVKPTIIFRGSRGPRSKLPWPNEKALYDTLHNIRVAFQSNAWADGQFCEEEILNVAADLRAAGIFGEVMIGMDNHSAQRTDKMLELYEELGLIPIFTAANCTDCISPVDHHIGRYIQNHMGRAYQRAIEANPEIWIADNADQEIESADSTSAMARRKLMAQWLSDAWRDLCTKDSHMIVSAFIRTGFLVAKDGSEDGEIQLQGWAPPPAAPYTYR